MRKQIPVIIDVDTGIDDAVALMLACKDKKLNPLLVVTCHGNTVVENITQNTLDVLDMLGEKQIPVAQGMKKALVKDRWHVFAHGTDGMGGYKMENSEVSKISSSALESTHNLINTYPEPITYICVAPSTNLAKLLSVYPEDAGKIKEAVIMAASNQSPKKSELPYREFNASVDPEAMEVVIASPVKKVFVTMEMGHTAYLDWQDVYKTKNTNAVGNTLEQIYRGYHDGHVKNGVATHDGCAVAYVAHPEMFEVLPANIHVNYYKEYKTGVAVVDYNKHPNCMVTTKVDVAKFKKMYFKCLKKCHGTNSTISKVIKGIKASEANQYKNWQKGLER